MNTKAENLLNELYMAKLNLSQMKKLKAHSVHHTTKHMNLMKKLMREGKTFKAAHTAAQKEVGK